MRIAVVDDDRRFSEQLRKAAENILISFGEMAEVETFSGGEVLLEALREKRRFDVYLLDVEMPGLNGLELADQICEGNGESGIVFVTSHEKYALQGYRHHACYYILKDEYESELKGILERICRTYKEEADRYYTIQTNVRYERFLLQDVLYVTKENKNAVFHCREASYRERASLAEVHSRLPKEEFIFIDRGQIVNLRKVVCVRKQSVELEDGQQLPISRYLAVEVKKQIARYWSTR